MRTMARLMEVCFPFVLLLAAVAVVKSQTLTSQTLIRCSNSPLPGIVNVVETLRNMMSMVADNAAPSGYAYSYAARAADYNLFVGGRCSHSVPMDTCTVCLQQAAQYIWDGCRGADAAVIGLGVCFIRYQALAVWAPYPSAFDTQYPIDKDYN